jgi:hypothetical protein
MGRPERRIDAGVARLSTVSMEVWAVGRHGGSKLGMEEEAGDRE